MKNLFLIFILGLTINNLALGQVLWVSATGTEWLTGNNWINGIVPSSTKIAQFSANPTANPAAIGICTSATQQVGAIEITNLRPYDISIGNSGTNYPNGILQINGILVNNISNVILRNNSSKTLTIKDMQGTSGSALQVALGNTTNNIINIDGSGGIIISSVISGSNKNLTKDGTGTGVLILTNPANQYSGTTKINQGELRLNPDSPTASFSSQVVLNSGTLSTTNIDGNTIITSSSTVQLYANSAIALGSNVHSLKFSASNAVSWIGTTLTITGWTGTAGSSGTAGKIFVGSNANGLTVGQLAKITFTGFPAGALILNTGEVVPASSFTPTIYYSRGNLAPDLTTSWNSNRDGSSGNTPSNFTSGSVFLIQNGHIMTTSGIWLLSGTNSKLQIENGGTLNATYAVNLSSATTFQIDNGGTYIHNNNSAVTIFSGIENFSGNSTVEIRNWVNATTPIPCINGTWGNLKITYNPGAEWNQAGNITSIAGNFIIDNSSGYGFCFTDNNSLTLTINGDLNIISGLLNFSNYGTTTNTFILNIGGSYIQTGGIFTPNLNASSTLSINFTGSDKVFAHSGGTLTNDQINWTLNSGSAYTLDDNIPVASGRNFIVNSSLDCDGKLIHGSGSFTLSSGATLKTSNIAGINGSVTVSGTKTINAGTNYIFNGSSLQVTGDLLPAIVNNFTVNNAAGLKLSNITLTITGTLTINNGTFLTLESGKQLTVIGTTILTGPECLILKSDATGTASFIDHEITGSGTIKIERFLSPDAWHYISSPVTNATAGIFLGDYLMTSDPSASDGWSPWILDSSTPLVIMRGYACWKPSRNSASEAFTGSLNSGDQTFVVNNNNGSGTFEGWHLVGNPFCSAVDLTAGIGWGTFECTAYFWNQSDTTSISYNGDGNYEVYPALGGWGTHDKYAPATQGFFLHNPEGNTSFTIPASARVHSNTTFLKTVKPVINGLLISVINDINNSTDKISIHFDPNATSEYDPGYDAHKLWGSSEAPQLYTRIGKINVTCNSLPFDKKNMVIPMGFNCGLNGHYRLEAGSIETFSSNIAISLEDLKLRTTHDLRLNPSYSFTYNTQDDANRFILHFDDATFGENDLKSVQPVQIYSFENCIYIKSQDGILSEGKVFVYDLIGKELFCSILINKSLNKIIPNLKEGYYLVQVITSDGIYNGKVSLK
jgi:autotransporter-associated beta strand protein